MSEQVPTYRVSRQFLINLCQQALYGMAGVVVSWILFWVLAEQLLPAPAGSTLLEWIRSPMRTAAKLSPYDEREMLRHLVGPALAIAVIIGGLADFFTWVFVRYEVHPTKLIIRWGPWSRGMEWDVIQTVYERPHATTYLSSLNISATGLPSILVRGLEQMPEFREVLRNRISSNTQWPPLPYRLDLSCRATNFFVGFLLPIPIHGTWLVGYVGGMSISTISVAWAWILVFSAFVIWLCKPMSRRHMCAAEIELAMAALFVVLSGLLTLLSWLESPTPPPWFRLLF